MKMIKQIKPIKQIIKPGLTLILWLFSLLPIKKNKIIFSSFSARSYSDNPKYIAEKMIQEGIDMDYVFVLRDTSTKNRKIVPNKIRIVKYNTLKYLYELATAKIWIDNTRKQDFVRKRKNQIYVQTWHGAIPFKKIEKDVIDVLDSKYISTAKHDSEMINYLLTDSKFGKKICQGSFWYNGKVVISGSPRLDRLINSSNELKKKAQNSLNLDLKVKYILYAPTFRENKTIEFYQMDFDRLIKVAEHRFGGEWQVLTRLHPNLGTELNLKNSRVTDVSKYPDIIELYALCEMLVTDYSSSMFEFGLTNKPVFLYTPDLSEYLNVRSSYFDIEKLPFAHGSTEESLRLKIKDYDQTAYRNSILYFYRKINVLEDGNASDRVIRLLMNDLN